MFLAEDASHCQPISWKAAFNKVATHLNKLNNPDEAVFYTSGITTNEAAFNINYLYVSLVRLIYPTAQICVMKPVEVHYLNLRA